VHWSRTAVAIIESRVAAAAGWTQSEKPLQAAVEDLLSCDVHCCKKKIDAKGNLRPAVVLALKLRRWVSDAHKWNTDNAVWMRQNVSARSSDALAALLVKVCPAPTLPPQMLTACAVL
jgi:hypothetical protein